MFRIDYRSSATSFALSEVPATCALVFLHPVAAMTVRVVASAVAIGLSTKPATYTLVFNGALFAFETAFAASFVHTIAPRETVGDGTS